MAEELPKPARRVLSFLESSFADESVDAGEAHEFERLLHRLNPKAGQVSWIRDNIFKLGATAMKSEEDVKILRWIFDMLKVLEKETLAPIPHRETHFFPNPVHRRHRRSGEGKWRIVQLMDECKVSLQVCVFNITDDDITAAIIGAHRRGVEVRVITDNLTAEEDSRGADAHEIEGAGVPLRVDLRDDAHMHHKFAVFDSTRVLSGSFNWTWSASSKNNENFLITDEDYFVHSYKAEFDRLWTEFGGGMSRDAAATKIQSAFRGRRARKKVEKRRRR